MAHLMLGPIQQNNMKSIRTNFEPNFLHENIIKFSIIYILILYYCTVLNKMCLKLKCPIRKTNTLKKKKPLFWY